MNCDFCEESFDVSWKLEKHMKTHNDIKLFKCDQCDATFLLEWRLKKHKESHQYLNPKFCHYFNNYKECPYEEIGCMFKHQKSPACFFQEKCRNNLCQFRHELMNCDYTSSEKHKIKTHKETSHGQSSDESENDNDKAKMTKNAANKCEACEEQFDDIDDLISHYDITYHDLEENER